MLRTVVTTSAYQAARMGETESVKKLLHMGDFHSVVDCVRNRITVQHTGIVSREVERRLRDKVEHH